MFHKNNYLSGRLTDQKLENVSANPPVFLLSAWKAGCEEKLL